MKFLTSLKPKGMAWKDYAVGLIIHYFPAFYHKKILPGVYSALTVGIQQGYPVSRLLPALERAPSIRAADFAKDALVEIHNSANSTRKIIHTQHRLGDLKAALASYETGETALLYACLDAIVEQDCLPHIAALNGEQVTLDKCAYYCLNKERGAYFPASPPGPRRRERPHKLQRRGER